MLSSVELVEKIKTNNSFEMGMTKHLFYGLTAILSFCSGFSLKAQDTLYVQDPYALEGAELYFATTGAYELKGEWAVKITEICSNNSTVLADQNGAYLPWFEIHNYSEEAIDIDGLFITDDINDPEKWKIDYPSAAPGDTTAVISPGSFRIVWSGAIESSILHTNFSLSPTGGTLAVFSPELGLLDHVVYGAIEEDLSYGWQSENSVYNYFAATSPGATNSATALFETVPIPVPNVIGGFYNEDQLVSLNCSLEGVEIFYTLDGSEPDSSDPLYTEPIELTENTILRCIAQKTGYISSPSTNHSYFFGIDSTFPIVSLVTEPSHWTGPDGMNTIANRILGVEKPVHIEFFEPDGTRTIAQNIGMKIHAPDSRPQQSLRIYARSIYGVSKMAHNIFPDKDISTFKRLVLRNGGNDGLQTGGTHFRDPLVHDIFKEQRAGNMYAAYRPAHVYLNGDYWGIYNIRERQDKHYIKSNYDETEIDLLERSANSPGTRKAWAGDWIAYNDFEDYLYENNMSLPEHEEYLLNELDIENAIDYYLTEIYTGNRDWLTNNIKFWKKHEDGKWRWLLWDTEYGMGRYPPIEHALPDFNSLSMAITWGGWDLSPANYGSNTRFLRHLVGYEGLNNTNTIEAAEANPLFKQKFISRGADLLNMYQREAYMSDRIDVFKELLSPEVQMQLDRWGGDMESWEEAIESLRGYTQARPYYVRQNMMNQFDLETDYLLDLNVHPENGGKIKVNTISPQSMPWDGYYFSQIPVNITAQANPGYQFVSWNNGDITTPTHSFIADDQQSFTAYYEEITEPLGIVINEINYNSHVSFDTGDWIELYNPEGNPIDMSLWHFKNSAGTTIYTFEEGTVMLPGDYKILCKDESSFTALYPAIDPIPADFNLSDAGDQIRLYDQNENLIDEVSYGVENPWSLYPNGNGPTLELIQATWDNNVAPSWRASFLPHGTPGGINSDISQQLTLIEQEENNFQEYHNFPNPFRESTSIRFDVSTAGNVSLEIFNISGQLVHQKNEYYSAPGTYEFLWRPSGLRSGIYYYRLKTVKHLSINKMLYLK